jgi:hypothetical protein
MRYPGENAAGRALSRRQGTSGRINPPEARPAAGASRAGGRASSEASLFAPGYSGGQAPGRDSVPAGGGWHGPPGGAAGKGPVRGFPPAPGQPPPLYPPGQFAAWNRAPAQDANGYDAGISGTWQLGYPDPADSPPPGYADTGYADTDYAEADYSGQGYPVPRYGEAGSAGPGYSALAVSDPAADVTSTQSWEIADDTTATSGWGDRLAGQGQDRADSADRIATGPNQRIATGPNQRIATGPNQRIATGPNQRIAFPATGPRSAQAPGRGQGPRGRGSRGRKRPRGRRSHLRALLICGLALIVVAGGTYLLFARGHKSPAPTADAQRAAASARPSPKDPSPSPPALGTWGHIETRALDPVPLTLAELFPASFIDGTTSYAKTMQKAKAHCAAALVGSRLISAVNHADCTQAMRASYLSSDHKLMGTIGVLNLITAAGAEQAGKMAGPAEYIAQLPAAKGPTKNLTQGTGFEAAEVKGHYLVLVWAEFADLHAPRTAAQKTELETFISLLMQKTANVSLATRQVTGSPPP